MKIPESLEVLGQRIDDKAYKAASELVKAALSEDEIAGTAFLLNICSYLASFVVQYGGWTSKDLCEALRQSIDGEGPFEKRSP